MKRRFDTSQPPSAAILEETLTALAEVMVVIGPGPLGIYERLERELAIAREREDRMARVFARASGSAAA